MVVIIFEKIWLTASWALILSQEVNGDREMVNTFPSICNLKERGASTFEGLHPFSDLYVPAAAKHLSPYWLICLLPGLQLKVELYVCFSVSV